MQRRLCAAAPCAIAASRSAIASASANAVAVFGKAPPVVPIATIDDAVTFRVELATPPEVGAIAGFKVHIIPAGAEQENCTVPENPPVGSAVSVKFADCPTGTEALFGDTEKLKSGSPVVGSTVIAPSSPCC